MDDVSSRQDDDQQEGNGAQLSNECHHLFQLFVESESQGGIHGGVNDRGECIHQQEAQPTDVQRASMHGNDRAERQELCRRDLESGLIWVIENETPYSAEIGLSWASSVPCMRFA